MQRSDGDRPDTTGNQAPVPRETPAGPPARVEPRGAASGSLRTVNKVKGSGGEVTIPALLRAFRRRGLVALVLGLTAGLAAGPVVWKLVPPGKYKVRTTLHLTTTPPRNIFEEAAPSSYSNYQKTQAALIKSRFVLGAALRQPKVAELSLVQGMESPTAWLETALKTEIPAGSEFLIVSLEGSRPAEMRTLLEGVMQAYFDQVVNREKNKRLEKLDRLKGIANQYDDFLTGKRRTMSEMAAAMGAGNAQALAHKQRFAQEQLAAFEKDLVKVQSDLRSQNIELLSLQTRHRGLWPEVQALLITNLAGPFPANMPWADLGLVAQPNSALGLGRSSAGILPDTVFEEYLKSDSEILKLLAERSRLEGLIAETLRVARGGERHSRVIEYRKDLAAVENAMNVRCQQLRPLLGEKVRAKLDGELRDKIGNLTESISSLTALQTLLQNDVQRLRGEAHVMGRGNLDMKSQEQETAQAEEVYRKVAHQVEILNIESDVPPRVTQIEDVVSISPDNAKKKSLAAVGASAGCFALAVLGVTWWEYRFRRLGSVQEVIDGLGIKVMGTIPNPTTVRRRFRLGRPELPVTSWPALLTESIDTARTMILHQARAQQLQTLMVTSAMPGEGKTSLSSHLAVSLARAGLRTLLLDCDLRNPAVHKIFELERQPGLCECLRDEADFRAVVQQTSVPGLEVLAAGVGDHRAIRAVAQGKLEGLLGPLRSQYEFIVIDSAPILPVVDSLLIAQLADGVIFSLLQEVSRLPFVYAACERLASLEVRVLGGIVNGTDEVSRVYGDRYESILVEGKQTV